MSLDPQDEAHELKPHRDLSPGTSPSGINALAHAVFRQLASLVSAGEPRIAIPHSDSNVSLGRHASLTGADHRFHVEGADNDVRLFGELQALLQCGNRPTGGSHFSYGKLINRLWGSIDNARELADANERLRPASGHGISRSPERSWDHCVADLRGVANALASYGRCVAAWHRMARADGIGNRTTDRFDAPVLSGLITALRHIGSDPGQSPGHYAELLGTVRAVVQGVNTHGQLHRRGLEGPGILTFDGEMPQYLARVAPTLSGENSPTGGRVEMLKYASQAALPG
ncbi:MAG: hypothetical protein AAF605_01530 [Myxococcota bacterium]